MKTEEQEFPLLHARLKDVKDQHIWQLLESLEQIRPQVSAEQDTSRTLKGSKDLVVHFLGQALKPYPEYKRQPLKSNEIAMHPILLHKVKEFSPGPLFDLCKELIDLFRRGDHIENYYNTALYVFLNKVMPKNVKPKKKTALRRRR